MMLNVIRSKTASASGFSNGTTFQWSGPGGFQGSGSFVTISVQGDYQIIAQGANGCTATQILMIPADLDPPQIALQGRSFR